MIYYVNTAANNYVAHVFQLFAVIEVQIYTLCQNVNQIVVRDNIELTESKNMAQFFKYEINFSSIWLFREHYFLYFSNCDIPCFLVIWYSNLYSVKTYDTLHYEYIIFLFLFPKLIHEEIFVFIWIYVWKIINIFYGIE